MILDEGSPSLASTIVVFMFDHVSFHRGLGNIMAEFPQFVSNPW